MRPHRSRPVILSTTLVLALAAAVAPASAATFEATVGGSTGSYGPSGQYWPSDTPLPGDDAEYDVEVDPTWEAIQDAIDAAPEDGSAVVRVRPGELPAGYGAGSTRRSVLANLPSDREEKVLVIARDGFGSVVGHASGSGYSINLHDVAMVGFDFSEHDVVYRSVSDFAAARSTYAVLNVTANAGDVTNTEFVDVAIPQARYDDSDTSAVRVAGGFGVDGLSFIGAYWAPSYKAQGSSAHTDSLQFSGTGDGAIQDVVIRDSVLVQSTNQGVQSGGVIGLHLQDTVIVGGTSGTGRYPVPSGYTSMTRSNALWGGALATSADGLIVIGSINSDYSWDSVTDSFVAFATGSQPASGAFQVEDSLTPMSPMTAWLDRVAPMPSESRLEALFSGVAEPEVPEPIKVPGQGDGSRPGTVPELTITPDDGAIVSGVAQFEVVAGSDSPIVAASVRSVEGWEVPLQCTPAGCVTEAFDTRAFDDGVYRFAVSATDADGDVTSVLTSVEVSNAVGGWTGWWW